MKILKSRNSYRQYKTITRNRVWKKSFPTRIHHELSDTPAEWINKTYLYILLFILLMTGSVKEHLSQKTWRCIMILFLRFPLLWLNVLLRLRLSRLIDWPVLLLHFWVLHYNTERKPLEIKVAFSCIRVMSELL